MPALGIDKTTLARLSEAALEKAIHERRRVIRYHRDQLGDDRCWLDDYLVWVMLEDTPSEPKTLPLYDEMMRRCGDFFTYRQVKTPDALSNEAIFDHGHWDDDLAKMHSDALLDELMKIQQAIRRHGDITDRPRTVDDDRRLYSVLPEKLPADFRLPPREEFLEGVKAGAGCPNFWRSHQGCSAEHYDNHCWGPCQQQPKGGWKMDDCTSNPDECRCSCHDEVEVEHIAPCCYPCPHCGRQIIEVLFDRHHSNCPGKKETPQD